MVLGGLCGAVSLRAAVQLGLRGSCGAVVLVYILDNNPQTSQPSLWLPATTSWGKRSGTTLEIS